MKVVMILSLFLLTSAAFAELTKEDLHDLKEDLHKVIKEEIAASEKRIKEYIDLKIDALDQKVDALDKSLNGKVDALDKSLNGKVDDLGKSLNGRIDDIRTIMIALIALITAAIAVPQIIMAYKERGQKGLESSQQAMQTQIDQLRKELEALQQ